jgi:hypothetical protein
MRGTTTARNPELLPLSVWRRGATEPRPLRTRLRAGPLDLWFEEGEIRSVCLGDREAVSRIYVAVRDRNWDTAPAVLSSVAVHVGESEFHISFGAACRLREVDFTWKGVIDAAADGTIDFSMDGIAQSTFLRNRIGFCILHPDTCAGARCVLQHSDGTRVASSFPTLISPHQPFLGLCGISHEVVPGAWVELSFAGEVFETEDQRNWTDASFKTYCTPLDLPFPVRVDAGTAVRQSVTLRLRVQNAGPPVPSVEAPRHRAASPSFAIQWGRPVRPLPRIGLCVASHHGALSPREAARLASLRLDHLRVEVEPSVRGWQDGLRESATQARTLGVRLLPALHLSDSAESELAAVGELLAQAPGEISAWLIFKRGEACTTDRWIGRARDVLGPRFPAVWFASGTNAHFAELNRGFAPGSTADGLVYSVSPQVHSFDDRSVMETLRVQASTVECALRFSRGKPVIVSPITLKARFNAVATSPVPSVPPGELPAQVDPRQMSLFGAAWTLGSISSLALAGASLLTFFETTGWRGVMETEQGSPVPAGFPPLPGCAFPLYHVLADVGEMQGGEIFPGSVDRDSFLAGLTILSHGKRRTMLANLGTDQIKARLSGAHGKATVRCLDETTVQTACLSPETFRSEKGSLRQPAGSQLEIELLPYAVARIDWED